MKKYVKIVLIAVIIVVVFIAAFYVYKYFVKKYVVVEDTSNVQATNTVDSSEPPKAADFTVYDENQNEFSLSSFQGKNVIVNFWANWCAPCVRELPHFQKAYEQYKDDVVFLMINVDGMPDNIQKFAKDNGYTFPIYYDMKASASRAYAVSPIPKTLVIDKNGSLLRTQIGAIDEMTLESYIKLLRR